MASSLESSTSGIHAPLITPEDVRAGTWSSNAPPPPGPALKPRTTLRSVMLLVIILALGATGLFERAATAWEAAKPVLFESMLAGEGVASAAAPVRARSIVVIVPVGEHLDRETTLVEESPGRWRQARCEEVDLSDCEGVGADACRRYDCS